MLSYACFCAYIDVFPSSLSLSLSLSLIQLPLFGAQPKMAPSDISIFEMLSRPGRRRKEERERRGEERRGEERRGERRGEERGEERREERRGERRGEGMGWGSDRREEKRKSRIGVQTISDKRGCSLSLLTNKNLLLRTD